MPLRQVTARSGLDLDRVAPVGGSSRPRPATDHARPAARFRPTAERAADHDGPYHRARPTVSTREQGQQHHPASATRSGGPPRTAQRRPRRRRRHRRGGRRRRLVVPARRRLPVDRPARLRRGRCLPPACAGMPWPFAERCGQSACPARTAATAAANSPPLRVALLAGPSPASPRSARARRAGRPGQRRWGVPDVHHRDGRPRSRRGTAAGRQGTRSRLRPASTRRRSGSASCPRACSGAM